jgi:hypothetical protein
MAMTFVVSGIPGLFNGSAFEDRDFSSRAGRLLVTTLCLELLLLKVSDSDPLS